MRMSICQIDLNNFAILSPSTSARTGTAALTFKEVTVLYSDQEIYMMAES